MDRKRFNAIKLKQIEPNMNNKRIQITDVCGQTSMY